MGKDQVLIIGAGLCGTLLALRLAQRGLNVSLFEKLGDLRQQELIAGRSINLALSSRGLWALETAGIKEEILRKCIPMEGRMIHPLDSEQFFSPYSGRPSDHINSVSRRGLNIALLNKAESLGNVDLHFNQKCLEVDLENAKATFRHSLSGEITQAEGAVVIGADGAGSAVRRSMMSMTAELLFDYSQSFLKHGYKELSIEPDASGDFRIENNVLHIWPRSDFMIIALPNLDGSFTLTMFHPFLGPQGFNQLDTKEKVRDFFEKQYGDLIAYCPHYLEEFFSNPVGILGTIKCYPWQAFGKTMIIGDAAHAIVPFYGQGMNASFEDVRILDEVLDSHIGNWEKVFKAFQELRMVDTNAIADLAIDNFHEMQERVDDADFIKKRKLEMLLEQTYPDYYSKYSLVTFKPELPYAIAMKLGRKQDELLLNICKQVHDIGELSIENIHHQLTVLASELKSK